jgi:hypothetical protein
LKFSRFDRSSGSRTRVRAKAARYLWKIMLNLSLLHSSGGYYCWWHRICSGVYLFIHSTGGGHQTTTLRFTEAHGRLSPWQHVISWREHFRKPLRVVLKLLETVTDHRGGNHRIMITWTARFQILEFHVLDFTIYIAILSNLWYTIWTGLCRCRWMVCIFYTLGLYLHFISIKTAAYHKI